MDIAIIVAMDTNRTIGRGSELPWHLPRDLQHFKAVTMGHPIIMGRKTHEAIAKALPGRANIVITRNNEYCPSEDAECAPNLETALKIAKQRKPDSKFAFVIGGAEIYKEALPIAQKMYITVVRGKVLGDITFPQFDVTQWKVTDIVDVPADDENPFDLTFKTLERD